MQIADQCYVQLILQLQDFERLTVSDIKIKAGENRHINHRSKNYELYTQCSGKRRLLQTASCAKLYINAH